MSYEDQFGAEATAQLLAAFPDAHGWPDRSMFFGDVRAVRRHPDGRFEGTGDARRAGMAATVE